MKPLLAAALFTATLASAQTATITVHTGHVENHISPRMYAAFVEMMAEDVKWGLTAEMLHDRSFEEATSYLNLPASWQLEPDERNDNVGAITFAQTTDQAYPSKDLATGAPNHALRISLAPADITDTRRGLSQGRLSIRAGQAYIGYVWIKLPPEHPYAGDIAVALEEDNTDGKTYSKALLSPVSGDGWKQYRFTLTPSATDRFAKLSLLFGGKGTLFLDQVSLQPADAKAQVRADSEAMIAQLRPSFLRWPGGNVAQDYHWQWGIGPRDLRPTWVNKSWSNAPEPDDLGTDEYLALCNRLHIEPSITVNVGGAGATAEEAAAWVEYVNGPATSKYGAMRAANGHPAPYGVQQWELGNEIFGGWVRGHVTAETYAHAAIEYARAMRAVDPNLKFVAVGQAPENGQEPWNQTVLRIAGPSIDYLAIHDYTDLHKNNTASDPRAEMMHQAAVFEATYQHTGALIAKLSPTHPIKLIVNEWNLFYGAQTIQSMEGAIYAARMMNGFEREADVVDSNCISDLLNGWVGGTIQASRDRIYGTPQFYAIKMYNDHLGQQRLQADIISPDLAPGVPALDAIVTRSPDGSTLFAKMSNADAHHALRTSIRLDGLRYAPTVQMTVLASTDPLERNTFASPKAVVPQTRTLHCANICTFALPRESVAVLTFHQRP